MYFSIQFFFDWNTNADTSLLLYFFFFRVFRHGVWKLFSNDQRRQENHVYILIRLHLYKVSKTSPIWCLEYGTIIICLYALFLHPECLPPDNDFPPFRLAPFFFFGTKIKCVFC